MHPLKFLERHFGAYEQKRTELLFRCPFCHHHKAKLSINSQTYYWKCWVCDQKGRSLLSLVCKVRDQTILTSYKHFFPDDFEVKPVEDVGNFVLELPDGYQPLHGIESSSYQVKWALSYLANRNISPKQILHHKIGLVKEGMFRNRIILPSFAADGSLNFFTGRAFTKQSLKYLNPVTPPGYKRTVIFNELNVNWRKPVYLVEGFFDMLKFSQNAIPLCGNSLSQNSKLFLSLVEHQPEVYVCLDSDVRSKQLSVLKALSEFGIRAYDLNVNPFKDVGEMSSAALAAKQTSALRCNRLSILKERIRTI